jgi:hypothetical protein
VGTKALAFALGVLVAIPLVPVVAAAQVTSTPYDTGLEVLKMVFPDPCLVVTQHYTGRSQQLRQAFGNLAWALLAALFTYSAVRGTWAASGREITGALGRLLVAGAIVGLGTGEFGFDLGGRMMAAWGEACYWSSRQFNSEAQRFKESAVNLAKYMGPMYMWSTAMNLIGRVGSAAALLCWPRSFAEIAKMQGDLLGLPSKTVNEAVRGWAITLAIYQALIVLSGIAMAVGVFILPVAGAATMHPAGGKWLGAWVSIAAWSLFVTALLPWMFAFVVDYGMAKPIEELETRARNAYNLVQSLGSLPPMPSFNDPNAVLNWVESVATGPGLRFQEAVGQFTGALLAMGKMPWMTLAGAIVSGILVLGLATVVAGYVGVGAGAALVARLR